jgi:hypothetical protein
VKKRTAYKILAVLLTLIFWAAGTNTVKAQDVNYKAYSVYVYNFIKYIEWPESAKADEFVIAIIGESPVKTELKTLAATKKANGKTIVIKQYNSIEEVGQCQILYISSGRSSVLKNAIERTKGMSALLIAEREGLAKKGAGINFVTLEDETLKFELNRKVIENNNLKVSNQLISLALVVK